MPCVPSGGTWYDDEGGEHVGWEVERLDSMARNIGPGDVVYDVGTEEGDISALVASWIGKGDGGVALFEPNPRVWPNVYNIFKSNDLKVPMACWEGFAGDENRHLAENPPQWPWPQSAYGEMIGDHGFCQLNERLDYPAVRLEDFMEMTGVIPTVITLDVEGSEAHVLVGANKILREHKPLVYASVHPVFMMEQYETDPQLLHDYMATMGYRVKHLATDHEEHYVFFHPHSSKGFRL